MKNMIVFYGIVAALLLTLFSCGGDTPTAPTGPTAAELRAQCEHECTRTAQADAAYCTATYPPNIDPWETNKCLVWANSNKLACLSRCP